MVIDSWQIYWLTRLDNIHCAMGGVTAILFILMLVLAAVGGGCAATGSDHYTDSGQKPTWFKWSKRTFTASVLCFFAALSLLFIGSFIPTTRDMLLILGVPALLNNQKAAVETLGRLPNKSLQLFEKYLDEKLTDKKESKDDD